MKKYVFIIGFALLLSLSLLVYYLERNPVKEIVIDFSNSTEEIKHNALGLTFGFNYETPKEYIDFVKYVRAPLWWFYDSGGNYGSSKNYQMANDIGMHVQIVLSDFSFGPGGFTKNFWPAINDCKNTDNWTAWENYIEKSVLSIKEVANKNNTTNVEIDLTNEPDLAWQSLMGECKKNNLNIGANDLKNNFLESWSKGFKKIKGIDSSIMVAGPSISRYDFNFLKDFIDYASDNNVMPDILTWHEFENSSAIPEHVSEIKNYLLTENISSEIQINEYISNNVSDINKPSIFIDYISAIEKSNVKFSARTCWIESSGKNGCDKDSLDNLIYANKKRSTWYVFKEYSEMSGKVVSSMENDFSFLSSSDKETIKIIFSPKRDLLKTHMLIKTELHHVLPQNLSGYVISSTDDLAKDAIDINIDNVPEGTMLTFDSLKKGYLYIIELR